MLMDYTIDILEFKIGNFMLSFPNTIRFDTFNNPGDYYGIDFYYEKYKFEVLDSRIGTRLLINGSIGEAKDLPFNKGTAHFLPDFVKVKQIT
jgi:hypothetical protein